MTLPERLQEAAQYLGRTISYRDDDGNVCIGVVVSIGMSEHSAAEVQWQVLTGYDAEFCGGVVDYMEHDYMLGKGYHKKPALLRSIC